MSYFISLSWRNIWRNRRRTLFTVLSTAFGVMALILLYNYYDSFHEQVVHNVIRYQSGHAIISATGYTDQVNPSLYLKNTETVDLWIRNNLNISNSSHRIFAQGLVSTARGSSNISFIGIEPDREQHITQFSRNIVRGKYLDPQHRNTLILGSKLAQILNIQLGSKVVALTQGVDGSIGNELFFVSGIFHTDSDFDKHLAFIHIDDARTLLSLPKTAVHQIPVVLKSDADIDFFTATFRTWTKNFRLDQMEIFSWKDLQKPLLAMIELNKSANRLLMIIILFVASIGITNSILMSILERLKEFGVMLTLGTKKLELVLMITLETLFITSIGVALGNLFGLAATLFFGFYGFDLAWLTSQRIVVQGTIIETINYPSISWTNSFFISSMVFCLSLVVSIFPLKQITRLDPVQSLRAL